MRGIVVIAIVLINGLHMPVIEINVAIYSSIGEFSEDAKNAIDYSWINDGIKYVIKPCIVGRKEIINGCLSQYDVILIPGEARVYADAMNEKWKNEIKNFIRNGGGYLGICGGANIASPRFLGIANITINDDQWEEWQYLWKANWSHGGIPLHVYIPYSNVPIFSGFYGKYRNMRYWGGAGIAGDVEPIAIFAEEPSDVAPLHYWIWLGKWIPWKNIITDIKGQYAACASRYGRGKVILFSPHPEKETFMDGHVKEFPVRPNLTPFTWFIYDWIGNRSNMSYNWWILRRSVAWLVDAPNPPASQTMVYIEEPRNGFYIDGRKIMEMKGVVATGKLKVIGTSINISHTSLYVDGKKIGIGGKRIEMKVFMEKGRHILRIEGENCMEGARNEIAVIVL